MSDSTAPSAAVTPYEQRGPVAKALGIAAVIVVSLAVVTYVGMDQARTSARTTLQQIFDEDAGLKTLKVESVYLPVQAGLPMSDMLTSFGLVPRKMIGNFMITRKDKGNLSNNCGYAEYDFTQSNRDGKSYFSVDGTEVTKLKMCSGALNLGNLLGNDD
jgi:hypothetical protein